MDEYIERTFATESIGRVIENLREMATTQLENRAVDLVQYTKDYISRLPAADVAPVVHARWETNEVTGEVYCSDCLENAVFTSGHHYHCGPYCPYWAQRWISNKNRLFLTIANSFAKYSFNVCLIF